uniref:Uncharacterized protein n=1 Tax=Knipowitschia caucasica TaxID=637954 RepID=A0AAV2IVI5_KNICA
MFLAEKGSFPAHGLFHELTADPQTHTLESFQREPHLDQSERKEGNRNTALNDKKKHLRFSVTAALVWSGSDLRPAQTSDRLRPAQTSDRLRPQTGSDLRPRCFVRFTAS